jgi:hypothetical protein
MDSFACPTELSRETSGASQPKMWRASLQTTLRRFTKSMCGAGRHRFIHHLYAHAAHMGARRLHHLTHSPWAKAEALTVSMWCDPVLKELR